MKKKKKDLAGSIVSDVLDGDSDEEEEWENNDGDAEDEFNQDARVTATVDPNQEQDVDEDKVMTKTNNPLFKDLYEGAWKLIRCSFLLTVSFSLYFFFLLSSLMISNASYPKIPT